MLTTAGAHASATISNHEQRITKLETTPERLAVIETKIDNISKKLDKMN